MCGAKPLSEPMLAFCELDPSEETMKKFYAKIVIYIESTENEFEGVA